jgi:hypothetical protein
LLEGVLLVIGLYKFRGMDPSCWFPHVVAFWVSLPFDKVLELSSVSMMSVAPYLLHFIFFFSTDKVRWRPGIVCSMCSCFVIGQQDGGMEHVVDAPGNRELESEGDQTHLLKDMEWTISFQS